MAKVLALRAQKTQLESKLQEWEEVHARTLGRPSTAQERQRSREHRELSRLVADVDAYIESLQGGGTGAPPPPQGGTRDAQRRAERGKIKAKMRRWERDFEKAHHRKPTEADIEASDDMTEWKSMLATTTEPSSSGGPVGIGGEDADVPSERAAGAASASPPGASSAGGGATSATASTLANTAWSRASDYHELLRARVLSQASVNGFDNVTASDVHAAAESFAAWDLDHDGVLSREEFLTVIASLSETPLEDETAARLFTLVDADGNGSIDFNEFLFCWKRLLADPKL